jgi:putative transposase
VARLPRSVLPDGCFHVYTRGIVGSTPFEEEEDRRTMMDLLPRVEWRHGLVLHVACVMSTHYHAIVEGLTVALSPAMHWLNWAFARNYNERHGLHGHVFSERFQTRVIRDEDGFHRACDYVLANPVRAGLCACIEDWPWSYSRYGLGSG